MEPHRVVVVSGHPADTELAALTAALAHHEPPTRPAPAPTSRWARAARLEARGHPPIDGPADLAWQEAPDGSR